MRGMRSQIYHGAHTALVPPEMFDRVQRILRDRTRLMKRRPTKILLTGLAVCSECGSLVGAEQHRRWEYYRCRGSARSENRCRAPYANVAAVHQTLEQIYRGLVLPVGVRKRLARLLADALTVKERVLAARRSGLRLELAALTSREAHLGKAFADGLMTKEAYAMVLPGLRRQREDLESQLFAAPRADARRLRQVIALLHQAPSAWHVHVALSVPEQRLLVEAVFERLEIARSGVVRFTLTPDFHRSTEAA